MAARVETLLRKLNKCAGEVSDEEISQPLLKMKKEFERALQSLSGDVEWKRDNDDALAKAISQIVDVVQVVEDITDLFSYEAEAISRRKSEIYSKMRQFLHKDRGAGQVLVFALGRISSVSGLFGGSFPDMLKNFSDQVCSHLEKLLWHIQITLQNGHCSFKAEVQFTDEDGWENIQFDLIHDESELTSHVGSEEWISGFDVSVWEIYEYDDQVDIAVMPEVGDQFSQPRSWPLSARQRRQFDRTVCWRAELGHQF